MHGQRLGEHSKGCNATTYTGRAATQIQKEGLRGKDAAERGGVDVVPLLYAKSTTGFLPCLRSL